MDCKLARFFENFNCWSNNVLKEEMSLVGPRQLLMEYLQLYSSEQNRRHEVKPGMTG
jgi:lipopolysaccharide/colanic/teichoic acid biosynthesis glycosyltransferase